VPAAARARAIAVRVTGAPACGRWETLMVIFFLPLCPCAGLLVRAGPD
jgi:hypothetical protein